MPKINKRLYGPAQLGNTTATRYTTPAATRTVIRHIALSNPTGGAVTVTASIGADAAGTRILDAYSLASGTRIDLWGPFTLEATEILAMHASAATSIVAIVDGEEQTVGA